MVTHADRTSSRTKTTTAAADVAVGGSNIGARLVASVRLALSTVFIWAFFDKTFGLGFATASENAWIRGGSPTRGFLTFGTSGPFAEVFQSIAGNMLVDVLFMVGLLGIGLALLLGIGLIVAAVSGAAMMVLMWLAALPPDNHPFMDDHIVYALVLLALPWIGAGTTWGLGARWAATGAVRRYRWLR